MKLIEKWRNRETKKKLREENIRLKAEMNVKTKTPPPVCTVERNIQRICVNRTLRLAEREVPSDIVKHELLRQLTEHLSEFVEYDFMDDKYGNRMYIANLYVATGDKRNERFDK